MATRYYNDEPDGETYTVCDTVEDLNKEIVDMGYKGWEEFKQVTGVQKPEEILGSPWIIVDNRLYPGKWDDITIEVDKDGKVIRTMTRVQ